MNEKPTSSFGTRGAAFQNSQDPFWVVVSSGADTQVHPRPRGKNCLQSAVHLCHIATETTRNEPGIRWVVVGPLIAPKPPSLIALRRAASDDDSQRLRRPPVDASRQHREQIRVRDSRATAA